MSEGRERDLVLAPNEYAYILDETKGNVIAYVGPHKTSLANTDRPVAFDEAVRRFVRCTLEEATRPFPFAPEGWYIVLENPAREGDEEHPKSGPNTLPKLIYGRKVNTPGPAIFPPWPGQIARVIQGHQLRSNQYLVVQVYNEEAARENWARAVIKPQRPTEGSVAVEAPPPLEGEVPDLTTGKLLVIQGTEVSFYMPPTGIEVVPDASGSYVREAVTLERLEYCILLDEDGNKRFIQGPAVVFPRPTEAFVERRGSRKFKAIELNEITGLYLKVIAPYTDETGEHQVGEELFLTGLERMIYFPRPEHAVVKYGDQELHHAVAIPAGEARYVLQRLTGEIKLQRGPCMFLPDPRREVIVRRALDLKSCSLMYPGNAEALEHNRRLLALPGPALEAPSGAPAQSVPMAREAKLRRQELAQEDLGGDDFTRPQDHARPRSITLDTRFDGAVAVNVWTGYAVQVVGRTGQRRVLVGPGSYLLEYDESLEALELSTGTPKSDDELFRTVYLRVLSNKVSDLVEAETADLVRVRILLSYRVNFEGDPERWFNVENYVKFLTDHLRSVLRSAIKAMPLEPFYARSIAALRDAVLGVQGTDGKRPGRRFDENGMHVYDVEVLDVEIGDAGIAGLLTEAQHSAVEQAIRLAAEERRLEAARKTEEVRQEIATAEAGTVQRTLALQIEEVRKRLELALEQAAADHAAEEKRLAGQASRSELQERLHSAELARERHRKEQELALGRAALEQQLQWLEGEVQAVVRKAEAVSPDLVAALQSFSDRALAERVAESMAPLAILGGKSVGEVFANLLKDTALEGVLRRNGKELPQA